MRTFPNVVIASLAASALFVSRAALAQEDTTAGEPAPKMETTVGEGQPPQNLPPPQSDDDPAPPPPAPTVAGTGVTEQAGIGGTQAYARAGVLELGGFANFNTAKNWTSIGFNPTFGWFFMDNVQLSAIVGINYTSTSAENELTGEEDDLSVTQVLLLAEPSFHIPFSESLYGFLGVGFGLASHSVDPDPTDATGGAGFAIAPRLGLNVMVGRSGIFTPALQGIYQTTETVSTPQGTAVGVQSSFGIQAGYTVMW